MNPSIQVNVIGIPRAKGRPRFSRKSGATYTPKKTVDAEYDFLSLMLCELRKIQGLKLPIETPIKLFIRFFFSFPKSWSVKKKESRPKHTQRPDLDNLLKLVLDACNGRVWRDDSQICEIYAKKVFHDGASYTKVEFSY